MTAAEKYVYHLLVTITAFMLAFGTIFYHFTEKWGLIDSYYFCVVTLATVGYGDLAPTTPAGKLFTTFYILVGIAILGAFVNAFTKRRGVKMRQKAENKHKQQ